ncbi:Phosphoribosyldiphosphate synthetase [Phytophthora cinnamomi]|uniref:Phosphoribosyldiphosphate synthetase n=1 Tax=Phytophthora cinnamomi TaxID=4785 RepID=UPI00355A9528|nr:Phosphoribosyldiphosphate synthetase [Phytophthora cinnamomi]
MSLIRQSMRALKAVNSTAAIRPAVARFSTDGKVHGVPVHNEPTEDVQVVIPEVHQTLEWCLSSPPPVHQFDEAPLVIETYGDVDPYH